jgi:hypothetical protein
MFQATRPSVRWSRVEIRRAKLNGCSCRTEWVKAKPRSSVTLAIAGISSEGSFTSVCSPSRTATSRLPR